MTMTIYDRITGPEMIAGWESFARQSKTAAGIVDRISMESGISVSDILSEKRTRPIAHARQDAMLAIREELDWSLPRIGRVFGRDHTTVKHGIKAAGERRKDQQTRSTPPNGAQGGQAPQSTDTASEGSGQGPTDLTQEDQKGGAVEAAMFYGYAENNCPACGAQAAVMWRPGGAFQQRTECICGRKTRWVHCGHDAQADTTDDEIMEADQ